MYHHEENFILGTAQESFLAFWLFCCCIYLAIWCLWSVEAQTYASSSPLLSNWYWSHSGLWIFMCTQLLCRLPHQQLSFWIGCYNMGWFGACNCCSESNKFVLKWYCYIFICLHVRSFSFYMTLLINLFSLTSMTGNLLLCCSWYTDPTMERYLACIFLGCMLQISSMKHPML